MVTDHFAGDSRTNRERMLAGDLYIADHPENTRIAKRAMRLCHEYHLAVIADDEREARELLDVARITIGDNSVIGAGSVVTRSIPADVVAVGNPARVLRAIP